MSTVETLHKFSRALALAVVALLVLAAAPALAQFGLYRAAVSARNQDGTPDTQAGSHPYGLTTTFVLNTAPCTTGHNEPLECLPEGNLKDARVELPPGFVGNPDATPRCTYQEFDNQGPPSFAPHCSNESTVGAAVSYVGKSENSAQGLEYAAIAEPVYNLVPPPGVAAEFGFYVAKTTPVLLQTGVRTGGDYGLTTTAANDDDGLWVLASKVTIWGVPADPAHDNIRGGCLDTATKLGEHIFNGGEYPRPPEAPGWGLREDEDQLEGPVGPYHGDRGRRWRSPAEPKPVARHPPRGFPF